MTKMNFRILKFVLLTVLLVATVLSVSACQKKTEPQCETKTFTFEVYDLKGEKTFEKEISTDKKTVGEALLFEGLIEGEDGAYGLYVKKVNGVLADYNVDGTYWAFYVGEETSMTGVDSTDIENGKTYVFKISK